LALGSIRSNGGLGNRISDTAHFRIHKFLLK
jgi:hypothetical protein